MGNKAKDLTGVRSGRLIALRREGIKNREPGWHCRCDCGAEVYVAASKIFSGTTRSCGCFKSDLHRDRLWKHGHSAGCSVSPTYKSWEDLNHRVLHHPEYAGRGISVCERWRDFRNFLADMGECPEGLTIDRIDNDGNYEPGNCRWATYSEQNANQRRRRERTKRHGNSRLTDSEVRAIFHDPRSGAQIAKDYGVSREMANKIKRAERHKHITRHDVFS